MDHWIYSSPPAELWPGPQSHRLLLQLPEFVAIWKTPVMDRRQVSGVDGSQTLSHPDPQLQVVICWQDRLDSRLPFKHDYQLKFVSFCCWGFWRQIYKLDKWKKNMFFRSNSVCCFCQSNRIDVLPLKNGSWKDIHKLNSTGKLLKNSKVISNAMELFFCFIENSSYY